MHLTCEFKWRSACVSYKYRIRTANVPERYILPDCKAIPANFNYKTANKRQFTVDYL